jgi:hypothetical protein
MEQTKLTIEYQGARLIRVKHLSTVLIVIDGSEKIRRVANSLAERFKGKKVVLMEGADFAATDILPAETILIGCEHPRPASFAELERVLKGINLAGRPCGLFSLASNEAIGYLRDIVRDADLTIVSEPYFADRSVDLDAWTAEILERR